MHHKDKIVIYQSEKGEIELRADIEKETIWATQEQISELFEVSIPNISMHLKNIFKEAELSEGSVVKDFLITASDGKKYKVKHYNLDAIIAIGYRVSSKKATQFRIWSTRILREYLVAGYSLNRHRIENNPEVLTGLYSAISALKSQNIDGKIKGRITLKITHDVLP